MREERGRFCPHQSLSTNVHPRNHSFRYVSFRSLCLSRWLALSRSLYLSPSLSLWGERDNIDTCGYVCICVYVEGRGGHSFTCTHTHTHSQPARGASRHLNSPPCRAAREMKMHEPWVSAQSQHEWQRFIFLPK